MILSKYLTGHDKLTYVSAEEGISKDIIRIMSTAGLSDKDRNFTILEYMPWEDLIEKMSGNKSGRIWIIDNTTVYRDELTTKLILDLKEALPRENKKKESDHFLKPRRKRKARQCDLPPDTEAFKDHYSG